MELDKIVILVMALGFFGGIGYVAYKSKHQQKDGSQAPIPSSPDHGDADASNKSRGKDRRNQKS